MSRTFKIITLGCKVNQYESASLHESLRRAGWKKASGSEETKLIVINTCIVTQRASYQSRQAIRKAIRENPSARIAALGCYGQVFPREIEEIEGVDLVLDNREKLSLVSYMEEDGESPLSISEPIGKEANFEFAPIRDFSDRTRAYLKIQDGCESFCSYCIVPYARGPLRSLDPGKALSELERISRQGYKEVVLTGIHLGAYGRDQDPAVDLKDLLVLFGQKNLDLRLRLSSIEPQEVDDELITMVAARSRLCRHFHIPLQSGDDGILKRMNRRYSSSFFKDLVERIYDTDPLTAIGVDVMVGFPGEDDRAFHNSYNLIQELPLSYLHVFPFSPRKGTPAVGFPNQVNSSVKKERAARLIELGQKKKEDFYRSCLGKTFSVLTEGRSNKTGYAKGLSDNYVRITFPSPKTIKNRMVEIMAEKVEKGYVIGKEN